MRTHPARLGGNKVCLQRRFYKKINTLHLDFTAREALNTDARENHSLSEPVVVRIYQLKDRQTFDRLVYQQLLEEGDILLAADLLASRDVVIGPGGDASSICRWKRRRRSWRLSACSAIRTHKEIHGSRCWRVRWIGQAAHFHRRTQPATAQA